MKENHKENWAIWIAILTFATAVVTNWDKIKNTISPENDEPKEKIVKIDVKDNENTNVTIGDNNTTIINTKTKKTISKLVNKEPILTIGEINVVKNFISNNYGKIIYLDIRFSDDVGYPMYKEKAVIILAASNAKFDKIDCGIKKISLAALKYSKNIMENEDNPPDPNIELAKFNKSTGQELNFELDTPACFCFNAFVILNPELSIIDYAGAGYILRGYFGVDKIEELHSSSFWYTLTAMNPSTLELDN